MLQLYLLKHHINQNISTLKLGKNFYEIVFYVYFFEYQSFEVYNPFLAVLLPFINKDEMIGVTAVYQLRKIEENAFRLLCSETNQKHNFDATICFEVTSSALYVTYVPQTLSVF